jgi:hypothetical protein
LSKASSIDAAKDCKAAVATKANGMSLMELKRYVRQRKWDASSGGNIVLSGKGRTTETIRSEVVAKLMQESSSSAPSAEPPIKITHDGVVFATSSNLAHVQCSDWESHNEPPEEAACKLAAEVLQRESRRDAAKNTKMSKWGSYNVELARCFSFRGVLVGDKPCMSVLVSHKASPPPELNLAELCNPDFPERVIGLEVRTLPKHTTGEVVGFVGRLGEGERRSELLALTKSETMQSIISKASEQEACWSVQLWGRTDRSFTYLASQLQPLLTFNNMERLDRIMGYSVNSQLARDSILKPYERRRLVDGELERLHKIAPDIAARLFPSPPSRVDSEGLSKNFVTFAVPKIVVGGNAKVSATRGGEIWSALSKHGLYRYEPSIGKDLRICGYILGKATKTQVGRAHGTMNRLSETLQEVSLKIDTGSKAVKSMKSVSAALSDAEKEGAHAVILFSASGSENMYYSAKQECFRRSAPGLSHLASQWIDLSRSDHQKPALLNISLQLCAKVGHTPYVSDSKHGGENEPVLCGVDVCHLRNPHAGRMEHIIAGLQLRRSNGEVEHSWVCQGKIRGESIPASVWKSVVSQEACAGRKVVIHRDGRFTDSEKSFLEDHAKAIGSDGSFAMVEIVKHAAGTPRLYAEDKNAPSGSFLRLSDTEGMLTSGSCPHQGTRNPLLVRVVSSKPGEPSNLCVEAAAEDIFRLSMLSYGTLYAQPRLPITTKTADKAAYFHASLEMHKSKEHSELALMSHGRQQYWL